MFSLKMSKNDFNIIGVNQENGCLVSMNYEGDCYDIPNPKGKYKVPFRKRLKRWLWTRFFAEYFDEFYYD